MQHMQAMNADLKVDAMEVRPVLGGKFRVSGCRELRLLAATGFDKRQSTEAPHPRLPLQHAPVPGTFGA